LLKGRFEAGIVNRWLFSRDW